MKSRWAKKPHRNYCRKAQLGFTMTELMVVVAIVAVLMTMAVPSLTRFVADWRLSNAVNSLSNSLRVARVESISRNKRVVLCKVDASTTCATAPGTTGFATGWIVFVDSNTNDTYDAGEEILIQQEALTGIANIAPKSNVLFRFQPSGLLAGTFDGFNFDSNLFQSTALTPWARRAICISKPGRIRFTNDSSTCTATN